MDDPTGNLDEENANMIVDILKSYYEKGNTVIIVTHSDDIADECQRIVDLSDLV